MGGVKQLWARLQALPGTTVSVAADGVAVVFLLVWGGMLWPMGGGDGLPFWATITDKMLFGPDAAAWAANALAFFDGRYDELDFHRMPTWTLMTAVGMAAGLDVVLSGHLVNHVMHLLLPVVLYFLGSLGGSRGAGLGAGMMTATTLHTLNTSLAYGVDTNISFLIPFMLLCCLWAARYWQLALLSGVVAALCSASHFTTLPYVLPSIILVLFAGRPGWRRWLGFLVHIGAAAGCLYLIFQVFPFPDKNQLAMAVQEGAKAGSTTGYHDANWSYLRQMMEQNSQTAANNAIRLVLSAVRPLFVPWDLALALPWIGVVGTFLRVRLPEEARHGLLSRFDWKLGLCLLLCLGPLPFLAMASAPERYSYNTLPIVLLLCWRGAGSILAGLDTLLRLRLPRWPAGLTAVVVALVVGWKAKDEAGDRLKPMPPPGDAQAAYAIGASLATLLSPGGAVAVPIRESAIFAGRVYCPNSNCPYGTTELDFLRCVYLMEKECSGEGPLAYVAVEPPEGREIRSTGRKAMDAWVLGRWPSASTVRSFGYHAEIVLIPREEAKTLVRPEQVRTTPTGPVPPPPR